MVRSTSVKESTVKGKGVDVVSYDLGALSIRNRVFAETGVLSILRYANSS